MRVRISVGEVEVEFDGVDFTKADLSRWFRKSALVAAALAGAAQTSTDEPTDNNTDGSTLDSHLTISGDDVPLFGFSRWPPTDPEWVPEEAP